MALAGLQAVGRRQPVAGLVPGLAREGRGLSVRGASALAPRGRLQLLLHAGPEILVDDRRMTPGPNPILVAYLTAVDRVCEDFVDLAAREMSAPGLVRRNSVEAGGVVS